MDNEASPVGGQYVVCASALACLLRLGVRNGTYAEISGVRRRMTASASVQRMIVEKPHFDERRVR
jgi:hypothetical protein